VVYPPKTIPAAVWRLAIGLTLMFLLAPATRFGYFIYPASLLLWLEVSRLGLRQSASGSPPTGSDPPPGRAAPAISSA
jgi:phosphatidylinositol alpha-1,6-mannosyltransferase